jgi:hypothetical protein
MPEVQEVFRMATQKVRPDPGFADRQYDHRRKQERRRKVAAFAVAAAIGVTAVVLVLVNAPAENATTPAVDPTVNPAEPGSEPVGTVTFDGSTCSLEITADRIEPESPFGFVTFRIVNASDQRVMFDSWRLLDGYTFPAFETAVERTGRLAEAGKPYPNDGPFPDQETEVSYLGSQVIPANGSGTIVTRMWSGSYAIACLQRFEGAHRSLRGFQPFGLAGPIVVR